MSLCKPYTPERVPSLARLALLGALSASTLVTVLAVALSIPSWPLTPAIPWQGISALVGALAMAGIIFGMIGHERQLMAQWVAYAQTAQLTAPEAPASFAADLQAADHHLNLVLAPDTLATFREFISLVESNTALMERQRAVLTANAQAQATLPRSVAYDPLTGAVTLTALMTRLTPDVQFACEHDRPIALAVFNIANFRAVNAQHGHRFGDEVLFAVADLLRTKIATGTILARLGGDHFAVVWPGLTRNDAQFQVEALLHAVAKEQFAIAVEESSAVTNVRVMMHAGLAVCPDDAVTARDLIALASGTSSGNPLTTELVPQNIPTTLVNDVYPRRAEFSSAPALPRREPTTASPWPNEYIEQMAQKHSSIHALTSALEAHDSNSVLHARSLAELAQATATQLGRPIEEARLVGLAALLHDVGSLGIPTEILTKAEPLSVEEWSFVREHPHLGERLLSSVGGVMAAVAPIVASHRERWDGSGYPVGLVGEAIPLGARIVAVCDVYGALISERPYRISFTHDQAMAELERYAGSQFDPQVIAAFCHAVQE